MNRVVVVRAHVHAHVHQIWVVDEVVRLKTLVQEIHIESTREVLVEKEWDRVLIRADHEVNLQSNYHLLDAFGPFLKYKSLYTNIKENV